MHSSAAGAVATGQPQLYGLKAIGEKVSIGEDGVQVLPTKVSTIVYLYGYLVESINVTFTRKRGSLNNDCSSMWLSGALQSSPVQDGVGQVQLTLEEPDDYFVCLFNSEFVSNATGALAGGLAQGSKAVWLHQGSSEHITLRAVQRLMPIWVHVLLILLLLSMSGLFSGLNLGLMALDQNELKVISRCGTESEKRYAKAIAPVRSRGNYLLCSLLFGNVLVNSSLTILMDDLTSGLIAIIGSTLSIVVFGEIIPQASCSRHGLAVGAKTIYLTYLFMFLTFPLSYPISLLLDKLLGDEIGNVYDRERLMEYIKVTKTYNKLEEDEVNIISGALCLKTKTAGEVMTRLEDVFMLPIWAVLDFNTVSEISKKGYSRIPVYDGERKNIVALLHAKDLAFVDPDDKKPLKQLIEFYRHPLIHTYADETLNNVLNHFKHGKSHMAFVRQIYDTGDEDPYYEITGLVTLEDVIEEILQMEILDETDILTDNRKKQKRKEPQVRQDFSEFAKIGEGQFGNHVISPQMGLATFQYLSTAIEPFSRQHITETVLRRLISQKIYFCTEPDDSELFPSSPSSLDESGQSGAVLYECGQPADYFIMLLEGRVRVVVGNERLTYESGPFTYFGVSALRPPELASRYKRSESALTGGDAAANPPPAAASRPPSPESAPLLAQATASRPASPELGQLMRSPSSTSEHFAYGSAAQLPSAGANLGASGSMSGAGGQEFTPDFTVQVLETTIYMKIAREVYLAAFRASLLDRKEEFVGGELEQFREEVDSLIYSQLAARSAGAGARKKLSSSEFLRERRLSLTGAAAKAADSLLAGNLVIGANAGARRKGSAFGAAAVGLASPKGVRRTTCSAVETLASRSSTGNLGAMLAGRDGQVVVNVSMQDCLNQEDGLGGKRV